MYYRTHSHAGFPKGSYLVPNPTHFHITRQTQIAIRRPVLVSVAKHNKSSHYLFNHGSKSNNSTVTINLGQAHSVSVKIPFETLTGFIFPLASALNFRKSPVLNNQACQTAYMNNFEYVSSREDLNKVTYTPLYIDSYRTCQTKPENANKTTSFEKRILANMQEHMLVDLSSESEYESFEVMNESYYESTKGDIIEFNEDDQEANESLVQITSEVAAMIPSTGSSSDISENPTNMDPNKDEQTKVDVQKITENNQRDYLNIPNNTSRDEGIDDCTMMETVYEDAVLDKTVEEIIIQLSNLILEYLIQQCYELKELILFPEVLHDSNFSKLLTKMTQVYSEFYRTNLSPEEKNEIRVSLATHTLKLLEIDERFNNSGDSGGSNTVSDKVFSISEFLNDILDHFFNSLETGGQFAEFALPLDNSDESVFHSTPEQKRKQRKVRDNEDENFEITTFHKKTVKSGSDIYWMSVSNSPSLPKKPDTPQRPIINVDDIPLRPPEDLIAPKRALSPIIEEPRVNLFYQFMDDHEFNILRDSNFNKHYNQDNNNVESSYDSDKVDKILTERCMDSYISFDRPESNVVLSNEVNFFRTKTINTNAYVASKTSTFKNSQSDNKENEFDNSGDWMGYETAKF
nr:uncharacterized protein LOC111514097 [Leptinotarsa decemlineata]